jgi:hypothetical protein
MKGGKVKIIQCISLFILTILISCAGKGDLRLIESSGSLVIGNNPDLYFYENRDNVSRSGSVEVNDKLFLQGVVSGGDVIALNIFDFDHTGEVVRVNNNIEGTISITLKINNSESDFAVISKNSDRISANFSLPGSDTAYQIISDEKSGQHYVVEMDKKDTGALENGPVLIPGERKK